MNTSLIGIITAVACMVVSIYWGGGEIMGYVDLPSIFIVFGGILAATAVSYPIRVLKNLIKVVGIAFKSRKVDLDQDVETILKLAHIARKEGMLALDGIVSEMDNHFLQQAVALIVDGSDPELVRNVLETELDFIRDRHASGQAVLLQMSAYSPAFGMIGTLIGLINMLAKLDDPSSLGPGMATALITTFYGSFLANVVFTPLAKKLGAMSDEECLGKEMILEGVLSIQAGENPRIIREKLNAYRSQTELREAEKKGGGEKNAAPEKKAAPQPRAGAPRKAAR